MTHRPIVMQPRRNTTLASALVSIAALSACHGGAGARTAATDDGARAATLESGFTENVCGEAPLARVTPHAPVDYMELRQHVRRPPSPGAQPGPPADIVVDRRGTPCASASDAPRCEAALREAHPDAGWTAYGDVPPSWMRVLYLVYTRGDEVGVVRSLDDLVAFLAPIDTASEAAWIVADRGPHRLVCAGNDARRTRAGFELLTETGRCPALEESVVSVDARGRITVVDTARVRAGDPRCTM